jgi:hypothetical protein
VTQGGKKETKAERKEQVRQQRLAEMRRRKRKMRIRKIWTWVIVGLVIAAIVTAIVLNAKGKGNAKKELDRLARAAGCTAIQSPPDLGGGHTQTPEETVKYNTSPPTSGRHFGQWDNTGVHTSQIRNEVQVHNLEHGHVIISYKPDIPQSFIDKLEAVAKVDERRVIVAPYNEMDAKLAITSWAHISTCNETKDGFLDFAKKYIDFYKAKGPEGDIPGTSK